MCNWISVKDRLPENTGYVLAWCEEEGAISAYYWKEKDCWQSLIASLQRTIVLDVTHWMPLPDPPKESE
jgi:hypothetical protein